MTDNLILSKSDRTSLSILDTAYELFTSQGYAATSMRQIAEGAGLALGSIYNHFPSKEDIFEAIILERHPFYQILPLIKESAGDTMDDFIRNAARNLVDVLDHRPEFFNLILTEVVEFKGKHVPKLFEQIFPDIMTIANRISGYEHDLRDIPGPILMRAFIGMFFSYFITGLLLKNLMPPAMQENALDTFVDIFLNGIKKPAELPSASSKFSTSEIL